MFGPAMRLPSVHGWIALLWLLLSVWLLVQGLVIHIPEEEMPAFVRNYMANHLDVSAIAKDVPDLKRKLKPVHRVLGAVGVTVGVGAAVAGC